MQKWEYMRFSVESSGDTSRQATIKISQSGEPRPDPDELLKNPPTIIEMLNNLGEAGWELVAVDQANTYLFKRSKA